MVACSWLHERSASIMRNCSPRGRRSRTRRKIGVAKTAKSEPTSRNEAAVDEADEERRGDRQHREDAEERLAAAGSVAHRAQHRRDGRVDQDRDADRESEPELAARLAQEA